MRALARNPAAAYRRVEIEARVEAAAGGELTRICIEQAIAALGEALATLERSPRTPPREALARAQSIALYLARTVDPAHPLHDSLVQFYGGLAAQIARSLFAPQPAVIAQVRGDFLDVLKAASAA